MKNQKPDHNSVVAKSNNLIAQMAKFNLSELRLIAYCLAHYDSRSLHNRAFTARVDDLVKLFPIDEKSAYAVVRQAMLNLGKKPLEFIEGKKHHYWNWFSGFTYDVGTGEFEFKITEEIQPYLLKLEGNFTPYRLSDVYQFKSASTWKLYELLKQWVKKRSWDIDLEELRLLLGVYGKYPLWNDLNRWLLTPAVAEINELSDIKVNFTKVKRGRSVVGLVWTITPKKRGEDESNTIDIKSPQILLCEELVKIGVAAKTAENYARKAENNGKADHILSKLPKIIKRAKKPKQKYVLGAITDELRQQSLYPDQEAQAVAYREAVKCFADRGGKCKRKTKAKTVCDICEKIHQ